MKIASFIHYPALICVIFTLPFIIPYFGQKIKVIFKKNRVNYICRDFDGKKSKTS